MTRETRRGAAAAGLLGGFAASAQAPVDAAAEPARITLAMMLQQGGPILWVILGLSVVTVVMAVYFLLTVNVGREAPRGLSERVRKALRDGAMLEAYELCTGRVDLLARVLRAGLKAAKHDRYIIQEAMESEGERGAASLWQRISYLNNVAVIAPLLGLLGTVWGMMLAFGSIALDNSQVKGLRMAESVALAMVTTAAGLVLAILAFVVYFYLRGQVVKIVAEVEAQATELVELIDEARSS